MNRRRGRAIDNSIVKNTRRCLNRKRLIQLFSTALILFCANIGFCADTVTTFDDLKTKIENATSTDPNINLKLGADINGSFDSVINIINQFITIEGKKTVVIDGTSTEGRYKLTSDNKDHRAFIVNNHSTLTILNTEIDDFKIFPENSVKDDLSGGVIYSEGELTITNSLFNNNKALDTGLSLNKIITGGSVYVADGSATITDSTFTNNYARRGGAIASKDFSDTTVTIDHSTFSNNTAVIGGGAISNGGDMLISNSTFTANTLTAEVTTAVIGGGAIRNIGSIVFSETNKFENNTSFFNGGAIFSRASTGAADIVFFDNVSFIGNKTISNDLDQGTKEDKTLTTGGGAIHNDNKMDFGSIQDKTGSATFKSNSTHGSGGAIFNHEDGIMHVYMSVLFGGEGTTDGNSADGSGGAIYNCGILNISSLSSSFINNTASMYGGAIRNSGTLRIIAGASYTGNHAVMGGGAISNVGNLTISGNLIFDSNSADKGGAIYNIGNLYILGTAEFRNNRATGENSEKEEGAFSGGAINNTGGELRIIGTRGADNKSSISFTGNSALESLRGDGGAIIVYGVPGGDQADLYVSGVDFTGNSAERGGAIRTEANATGQFSYSYINDCTFKNNYARGYGGAVGSGGTNADVLVSNSTFIGNYLASSGGVYGGALTNGHNMTIINSEFKNNFAVKYAGAVSFNGSYFRLIADGADTVFSGNYTSNTKDSREIDALGFNFSNKTRNGMAPALYLNAGNGGSIIFDDSISSNDSFHGELIINSPNNILKTSDKNYKDLSTYSYYVPNATNTDFELVTFDTPYDGDVYFNESIINTDIRLYNGTVHIADNTTRRWTKYGYFAEKSSIYLYGGTISFANGQIESKASNLLAPENFIVYQDANMKLDVDLKNRSIDYINADIKGSGTLTIDKLLFSGSFEEAFELGKSIDLQFAKSNSGNNIVLLDTLQTVITSEAGYGLSLATTTSGKDTLRITKRVSAGGLPVAVSIGEIFNVSTYIYSATTNEIINKWGVEYTIRDNDGNEEYKTASNKLNGSKLVINGNSKNVISTGTALEGIKISSGQVLTINDVGTYNAETNIYRGWTGFNSALINEGGTININDSIFIDNDSLTYGGAIYNTNGVDENGDVTIGVVNIVNTSFINNTAVSGGGAIYNKGGIVNIIAENYAVADYYFIGDSDAIYNDGGTINLATDATSSITFDDNIVGTDRTTSNINIGYSYFDVDKSETVNVENKGSVIVNKTVSNSSVTLNSGTLAFGQNATTGKTDYFSNVDLTVNGGTLNLQNGQLDTLNIDNLNLAGDLTLMLDIDLSADNLSDEIVASSISGNGIIEIDKIRITNGMTDGEFSVSTEFISEAVNSTIQSQNTSIAYDGSIYLFSLLDNKLTVSRQGSAGDFAYEVAIDTKPERTYQVGSEDTVVGHWINGNNRLSGTAFYINGGTQGKAIDGSSLEGIVAGYTETGSKQLLEILDVTKYTNFNTAVINNGANILTENTNFEENHSTSDGGVIRNNEGIFDIRNGATFKNNSATGKGGAIYNNADMHIITQKGDVVLFEGNTASEGADIYLTETGELTIAASTGGTVIFKDGIAGSGTISKLGTGALQLYGDNSGYTGKAIFQGAIVNGENELFAGETIVGVGAKFFSGDTTLGKTTLKWFTNNDFDYENATLTMNGTRFILGDGVNPAQFTYKSGAIAEESQITINENATFISEHDIVVKGNVFGHGTFKAIDAIVTFDSVNNGFSGTFEQNGGITRVRGWIYVEDITVNNGDIVFLEDSKYFSPDISNINLNNANLKGDIVLSGAVITPYNLNITGNTTINGNVDRAYADLTGADSVLKIADNTFDKAILTANEGTIDLIDNSINNIEIQKLVNTTTNGINVKIDIDAQDLSSAKSDKLILGDESNATVTISSINMILGSEGLDQEFVVKVIDTESSNVTLQLSDELKGTSLREFGTATKNYLKLNDDTEELSVVEDIVSTSDRYKYWNETIVLKGLLDVKDEHYLAFEIKETTANTPISRLIDSLSALNQKVSENERKFNFVSNNEIYNVSENLGETAGGTLSINGTEGAVIDLKEFTGFELSNETTLNLNNVKLQGDKKELIWVSNTNADINLNNAYIDGNITADVNYDLNIQGNTTLNGSVGDANATLSGADSVLKIVDNTFAKATLTANAGTIDLINSNADSIKIDTLNTGSNVYLNIDIDVLNNEFDTITTINPSSGTLTIKDINFVSQDEANLVNNFKILNTNSNLQLALSKTKYFTGDETNRTVYDDIDNDINVVSNDQIRKYNQLGHVYNEVSLKAGTTDTISITYGLIDEYETEKTDIGSKGDTLALWNTNANADENNFNFISADQTYEVTSDLGESVAKILNINGYSDEKSTINLDNHKGFELKKATTLNFNNVTVEGNTNLVTVSTKSAVINLDSATLNGNISSSQNYNLGLAGNTTLNGTVDKANATLTSGNLVFNTDTFENATLNATAGNIDLQDNVTLTYSIDKLVSTDTKYSIDINATDQKADVFSVGANSTGTIIINSIKWIDNKTPLGEDWTVKVLDLAEGANVTIVLDNSIKDNKYIIATIGETTTTRTVTDEVETLVKYNKECFTKVYIDTVAGKNVYGNLVASGDSLTIGNVYTDDDVVTINLISSDKLDTLKLISNKEATGKTFDFTDATYDDNKYTAIDNIGTLNGDLTIAGVNATKTTTDDNGDTVTLTNQSTVDLNGKSGFELAQGSTLNINNATLKGSATLITVNETDTTVSLNNVTINGNISNSETYNLAIEGNTTINGLVGSADATLSGESSVLKVNSNTLIEAKLTANEGTIDLANSKIETINIGTLTNTSTNGVNVNIDVNATTKESDVISVGTGSSGVITIKTIQWVNNEVPGASNPAGDNWTINVLTQSGSDVTLRLDETLKTTEYVMACEGEKTVDRIVTDEIAGSSVKYSDEFYINEYKDIYAEKITYGKLDVVDNVIKLNESRTAGGEVINPSADPVKTTQQDTLALISNKEVTGKIFDFTGASADNNKYEANANIGTLNGDLTIQGVTTTKEVTDSEENTVTISNQSVVDLKNNTGFELANNSKLTVDNATLTGNYTLITANNSNNTVELKNATLDGTMVANNNATVNMKDSTLKGNISSTNGYQLNLDGDTTLNGSVGKATANINGGTLNLPKENTFADASVTANGGTINLSNGTVGKLEAQSFTVKGNIFLAVDADLSGKGSMDTIQNLTIDGGSIDINKINLLKDATKRKTIISFVDKGFSYKDSIKYSGEKELTVSTALAPIYKYSVKYNSNDGTFTFLQGGGSGHNGYNAFNPAIMSAPIAAQAGAYTGMQNTFDMAFNSMEMRMLMPSTLRMVESNANKYAITELNVSQDTYLQENSNSVWVKPYTSYDSIKLHGGASVRSTTYGSFVGADSKLYKLRNGFEGMLSPYLSYMGSYQVYAGNTIDQNGGSIGLSGSLYKGNFFSGLTIGVGSSLAEEHTMYGRAEFPMLMAGIASKTGYNFEFKGGSFIIQPSILLSYTFINTFDYKNAAGVSIDSDPMHTIQLAPSVKFIKNTRNNWQPYFTIGMRWNLMGHTSVTANDVTLPELSINPYLEYGLGIHKILNDRFSGYAQVTVRNGGRNGISGAFGLKFLLGKKKNPQRV